MLAYLKIDALIIIIILHNYTMCRKIYTLQVINIVIYNKLSYYAMLSDPHIKSSVNAYNIKYITVVIYNIWVSHLPPIEHLIVFPLH